VETLVAQAAVEALDVGVLVRLPGLDEVQLDAVSVGPRVERSADELRAIVGDQHRWLAARVDQALQQLRDSAATDRRIGDGRQARRGEVVDHGENAKRRPSSSTSMTKSSDQRSLMRVGAPSRGTPRGTRRRRLRRRTVSPSWV